MNSYNCTIVEPTQLGEFWQELPTRGSFIVNHCTNEYLQLLYCTKRIHLKISHFCTRSVSARNSDVIPILIATWAKQHTKVQ